MLSILRSRRGETLMEGITSVLVFSILIAAVTMIITVSLRVSSAATMEAQAMQAAANEALRGEGDPVPGFDEIVFTVNGENIIIDVAAVENNGFIAFAPVP
jgi:Tfp pilus assembly protein PilV